MKDFRIIILAILLFIPSVCSAEAEKNYQVDILVFAQTEPQPSEEATQLYTKDAHLLEKGEDLYQLLGMHASQLKNAYYALRKKPQYQILAHYSWLQPLHGTKKLLLNPSIQNGWQLVGTLDLKKNQHYLLNTKMAVFTEDKAHYYVFAKKERLKANQIYYLDHPGVGMFIKIQNPLVKKDHA